MQRQSLLLLHWLGNQLVEVPHTPDTAFTRTLATCSTQHKPHINQGASGNRIGNQLPHLRLKFEKATFSVTALAWEPIGRSTPHTWHCSDTHHCHIQHTKQITHSNKVLLVPQLQRKAFLSINYLFLSSSQVVYSSCVSHVVNIKTRCMRMLIAHYSFNPDWQHVAHALQPVAKYTPYLPTTCLWTGVPSGDLI